MHAVAHHRLSVVWVLLKEGPSTLGIGGVSSLHISAQRGDVDLTKMLVEAGADLDSADPALGFTTPLHLAASEGCLDVVMELILAGANLNSRMDNGATPLHRAAVEGQVGAVELLLCAKPIPLCTREIEVLGCGFVPFGHGGGERSCGGDTRADSGAWDRRSQRCKRW